MNPLRLGKTGKQSRDRGKHSEKLACQYLQRHGLKLIAQNYASRYGEIDLIMRDKDTLVFAEVRYRYRDTYGSAIETIDAHKQSAIVATAEYYLQRHPWDGACRFDAVLIQGEAKPRWVINAFEAE